MKYTNINYSQIRDEAEQKGIILTDPEFLIVVDLCTRKIERNGLEAEYMNTLLPDELEHYAFQRYVNITTAGMLRKREEKQNGTNHRETVFGKCQNRSACGT